MTGEGVRALLFERTATRGNVPVLESQVPKLVRQSRALPHRVSGSGDADEHPVSGGVAHGQAVFVGSDVKDGNIEFGGLLDQGNKVAQRLDSETVRTTELPGRLSCLMFDVGGHHCAAMAWSSR